MNSKESSRDKAKEFLKNNSHGVLSTVSEDGKPWGSSIYFATDEDLNFFFITRVNTHKYQNIAKNHNVSLVISDNETQKTVQVAGKVSKVPAKDIVSVVMKKLAHVKPKSDNKWVPPIVKVNGGDYMVLKITPTRLQYADYQQIKSNIHDNFIEQVI